MKIITPIIDATSPEPERDSRPRILLVDDHNVNVALLTHMLAPIGAQFDVATDGSMAVKKCAETEFDIILMDINMPVMNGIDATAAIRASTGPCRQAPIIAVTGDTGAGAREKYLAAGMTDYIEKPVDRLILLDKVTAAVAETRRAESGLTDGT